MSLTPPDPAALPTKYRVWVARCPFKKNGAPSLGTFGKTIAPVIVMRMETWNRLCAAIPDLQTTQFEVGHDE